jgi:hypothetical protein
MSGTNGTNRDKRDTDTSKGAGQTGQTPRFVPCPPVSAGHLGPFWFVLRWYTNQFDGWYRSKHVAKEMLTYWNNIYPDQCVLVKSNSPYNIPPGLKLHAPL